MGNTNTIDPIKKTSPAAKVLMYIFLAFWALVNLVPIYFMFTFSLKSNEEIFGANIISIFLAFCAWKNAPIGAVGLLESEK